MLESGGIFGGYEMAALLIYELAGASLVVAEDGHPKSERLGGRHAKAFFRNIYKPFGMAYELHLLVQICDLPYKGDRRSRHFFEILLVRATPCYQQRYLHTIC